VDELFSKSNQNHWFITCSRCNHRWFIDFEESPEKNHFVDQEKEVYRCGNCKLELDDEDRRHGEWIPAYPERNLVGYWMSQLLVPYVTAKRVMEQYHESDTAFFFNFVLGKAYQSADMILSRDVVVRNISPKPPVARNVAMGVDVGKTKHYVIGTPSGILEVGTTDSWEKIEYLRNQYKAKCVIDALPEFTTPAKLMKKYKGEVFAAYYVDDKKNAGIIRWLHGKDRGIVHIDRTKAFDTVVQELTSNMFNYYLSPEKLEDYIYNWSNIYRIVERNKKGVVVAKWVEEDGKPDHFAHAHLYYRVALEKVFGSVGDEIVETDEHKNLHKDPGVLDISVRDD
jgi:DNA-directed RNA polymerase subunit RPC12/RpoP